MKHAILFSIVTIAAAMLTLAGCGPQTTPAPEVTTPPQATTPPEATATPEPTARPTQEPVTIVYWSMWNESEPQGQVLKQAIEDFQAAYPYITVNVTWNGRENRNLVGPALEAGESIDVFDTGDEYILVHFPQYLTNLEPLLDDPAIGVEGKSVRETLINQLLYNFTIDGKAMILPYQPYAVLFFYNKAHFEDAGITKPPTTFDELLADCQALVDAGHPCLTTDVDAYLDILWGYSAEREFGGCQAVDDAMADKTGESWRDPKWLDAAQKMASFAANGYLLAGTEGNLYPAGQQALALGEVTMYLNGTWLPTEVQDTAGPDFQWGSFSFPNIEGGNGSSGAIMTGSQALALVNSSKHPAEAWLFMKWIVSKDVQQAMVDVANVPAIHTDVAWPEDLTEAQAVVANSTAIITWGCDLWKSDVGGSIVLPAFQELFLGKITPEAYIERLVTETADYWASHGG